MRTAQSTDFTVDVEGFGRFVFARRTVGDVFKIRARYNVLTEGFFEADGRIADLGGLALVTIQTLMVSAPEGFAVDDFDPILDENFEEKIVKIYGALRAKEQSFRPSPSKGSEIRGEVAGGQHGVLVPAEVQPESDGPDLSVDHARAN